MCSEPLLNSKLDWWVFFSSCLSQVLPASCQQLYCSKVFFDHFTDLNACSIPFLFKIIRSHSKVSFLSHWFSPVTLWRASQDNQMVKLHAHYPFKAINSLALSCGYCPASVHFFIPTDQLFPLILVLELHWTLLLCRLSKNVRIFSEISSLPSYLFFSWICFFQ